MTDQSIELPASEPYPFATVLSLTPGDRHELLTAVVFQSDPPKCGNGYRYRCLFPVDTGGVRVGYVYSDEIAAVVGLDLNGDVLCSGCTPEMQERCAARGVTPATCA